VANKAAIPKINVGTNEVRRTNILFMATPFRQELSVAAQYGYSFGLYI
jgi:hypothetical protein